MREFPDQRREVASCVRGYVLRVLWVHLRQPNPLPGNRRVDLGHTLARACLSTRPARACASPSPRVGWSVCPRLWRGCSGARTPVPRELLLEFGPAVARSSSEYPKLPWSLYALLSPFCSGAKVFPLQLLRSHTDIVVSSETPRRPPTVLRTTGPRLSFGASRPTTRREK
jgi:hypothetical protein